MHLAGYSCIVDAGDNATLELLVQYYPAPFTVEEITRALAGSSQQTGDPCPDLQDSLARLFAAGLIHRVGSFVLPTRAAVEAAAI